MDELRTDLIDRLIFFNKEEKQLILFFDFSVYWFVHSHSLTYDFCELNFIVKVLLFLKYPKKKNCLTVKGKHTLTFIIMKSWFPSCCSFFCCFFSIILLIELLMLNWSLEIVTTCFSIQKKCKTMFNGSMDGTQKIA